MKDFPVDRIIHKPTPEQVKAAHDYLINDVFGEFPFDDGPDSETKGDCSRAHFLAMLLQPFVRPMINGPTPMYLVSKPTMGTGASLLVGSAIMINHNTKEMAKAQTAPTNDEEARKNITSAFKSGNPYMFIDNINGVLSGSALANLATAREWEDRELGVSKKISFPNRMLVVLAGNNVRGSGEIMRRCLPIRLDAKGGPNEKVESRFK